MDTNKLDISKKLETLLYSVQKDDAFVDWVFACIEYTEEAQLIIDYIERGENVDQTQIGLLALDIANARDRGETFTDADI